MKKICMALPLSLILCFMVGCQDKEAMAELEEFRAQAEIEEQNKEVVKSFFDALNEGNTEILKEFLAPDYSQYIPSNSSNPRSFEEAKEALKPIFGAFPDFVWSIEDLIAVGDKVMCRVIFKGTHEGEYMGIPPTGNKVELGEIFISRFENGKIVEYREEYDSLGLMQQLGMELKPKEGEQ
jgi:steroid delta-isomerase-like uncharacterized protein